MGFFFVFSNVEADQKIAERSICVYGVKDEGEKFKRKLSKCGSIDKVCIWNRNTWINRDLLKDTIDRTRSILLQFIEDQDGFRVAFSSVEEAELALNKFHGKKGAIVCQDLVPPILVAGHKPDLFVIKDVPDGNAKDKYYSLDCKIVSHHRMASFSWFQKLVFLSSGLL